MSGAILHCSTRQFNSVVLQEGTKAESKWQMKYAQRDSNPNLGSEEYAEPLKNGGISR
jgi:hypothetical protein